MNIAIAIMILVLTAAAVFATQAHRAEELARRFIRMADGEFLMAFSELLAKVAMADGTVSAEEVETIERMFGVMDLSRPQRAMCVGNFLIAQREQGDAKGLAERLSRTFNHVACRFVYGLLLRVALADKRIDEGEARLLGEIGEALGLSGDEMSEFRDGKPPAFDRTALESAGVPDSVIRLV